MLGKPGQDTRPDARLSPSFLFTDARMLSQLNVDLIRKLRRSLLCLAYSVLGYCYPWMCVQPVTGRRPVDWCMN